MGETFNIEAAYVDLTSPEDGDNEWTVEQTEAAAELSIPDQAKEFSWSFGAISCNGFVDLDTYDMTCTPVIGGIYVGIINGSLKDGFSLKVNLDKFRGELRWYLKNGNELWIRQHLKVTFKGSYEGDYKIITF